MSTLLKKKGAASFKPRAPVRRPAAPPKPAAPAAPPTEPVVASDLPAPTATLEQDKPLPSIESTAIEPQPQAAPQPAAAAPVVAPKRTPLPTPAATQVSSATTSASQNAQEVVANPSVTSAASAPPPASPSEPVDSAQAPEPSFQPAAPVLKARPVKPLSALARKRAAAVARKAESVSASASAAPDSTPAAGTKPFPTAEHEYPDPETAHDRPQLMPQAHMGRGDESSAEGLEPAAKAPPKKRATRKRKISSATVAVDDDGDGTPQQTPEADGDDLEIRATQTARKSSIPKKPRKSRAKSTFDPENPDAPVAKKPRKSKEKSTVDPEDPDAPPKRRGGRKREPTPEDAQEQVIDPTSMKMSDLTRDIRIGKKFSRHDEIEKRDADRKARLKARRENPDLSSSDDDRRRPKRRTRVPTEEAAPVDVSGAGPRMRLVDGQIVIDETSLNLDRHKVAAANAGIMEIVQEDEFTHITNSATYMKKEKNKFWGYEEEEKFYDGLRQFGTDFEMIALLFKDRSRRHIKLKFNKEERVNPDKITAALIKEKVPIDFDTYQKETGLEFIDTEAFHNELAEVDKKHAEEEAFVDAEREETIRKKKAAIHGNGEEKENEGQPAKKKTRSKKNKASAYGGGEEVEDLGEI